jgi:hypothetical protein
MTLAKFLLRTVVTAVVTFALGYAGHQLLLGRDYVAIKPIMRSKTDMMAHMPFALINCLVFSAAFVWIYAQGRSAKPWLGQGLRFGIAVWALASVPLYITNYVIEPWPGMFVAKIVAWELVAAIFLGILIAALAKKDGATQSQSAGA